MATLVLSESAPQSGARAVGSNSGVLSEADFQGCRWIEGAPRPLPSGMFCGRLVAEGESWCARHHGIVYGVDGA